MCPLRVPLMGTVGIWGCHSPNPPEEPPHNFLLQEGRRWIPCGARALLCPCPLLLLPRTGHRPLVHVFIWFCSQISTSVASILPWLFSFSPRIVVVAFPQLGSGFWGANFFKPFHNGTNGLGSCNPPVKHQHSLLVWILPFHLNPLFMDIHVVLHICGLIHIYGFICGGWTSPPSDHWEKSWRWNLLFCPDRLNFHHFSIQTKA